MLNWKEWIIRYAKRTPYTHLGDYMSRWWIVPYRHELKLTWYKNPIGWFLQQFDIAIRVHEIKRGDSDRALHNHPWPYITLILKGGYIEVTEIRSKNNQFICYQKQEYVSGDILFRSSSFRHRLELFNLNPYVYPQETTTTLFITFRKNNEWGFYETPDYFIHHKNYLKKHIQ
jgi:hypothetical protein